MNDNKLKIQTYAEQILILCRYYIVALRSIHRPF